ncbi:hypothetical protein PHPALM_28151 [Phytophthora palmivora]|uniref:Putative auto-transporter adhesin head GIN domain-containing protein n=1 Tax=Phytophthora palmivora TaxID=4796 RepID=A0A2P4XAW8_9STRA|nr:hypothetical protein PHPALM_28151 [Phytophthora palmivora]
MAVIAEGSGDACLSWTSPMTINQFEVQQVGSGDVSVGPQGSCRLAKVSMLGSGELDVGGVQCDSVDVDLMSSGKVVVHATNALDVEAYGSGHVQFTGSAPHAIASTGYKPIYPQRVDDSYLPTNCKRHKIPAIKAKYAALSSGVLASAELDSTESSPPTTIGRDAAGDFWGDVNHDKDSILPLTAIVFLVAMILLVELEKKHVNLCLERNGKFFAMHSYDVTPFWTVRCTLSDVLCNEDQDFVVIVTGSNDVVIRFDDSINGGNGDVARVSMKNSFSSAVAQLVMIDNLPVLQLTALGDNLDVVLLRKNHVQRVVNRGRKTKVIHVQQDNAGPHLSPYNADIVKAGEENGWNIELMSQPPRSPDLNTLDLGIFNALQALQLKHTTKNLDGLIFAVQKAFADLPSATIDKCFVTLQKVMQSVILHEGGNDYKLPRLRKDRMYGPSLPVSLPIEEQVVDSGFLALDKLNKKVLVTSGPSLTVSANGSGDIRVKSSSKLTVDGLSLSSQGSGRIHALFSDVNAKSVLIQVLSSGDIAMLTNSTSVESSMSLSVLGSGSLCVSSMETDRLKIKKVGTGDISLGPLGSCEDAEVSTGGSGTIDIGGIQCHNVNVDLLGSGNVVVQATNSLTGDVYGSGHLKYYGEAPQSIDNVNYMGLVTAMPVSSTYHPAECKVKSFSPLKPTDSTSNSPSRPGDDEEFNYDLTNDKSNIIYLAGVVFLVALILRWFNESRRRTREEQRQPLVGAERRVLFNRIEPHEIEEIGAGDILLGPRGTCPDATILCGGSVLLTSAELIAIIWMSTYSVASEHAIVRSLITLIPDDVFGSGHLKLCSEAPQSIDSRNYVGLVTVMLVSSSYHPPECKITPVTFTNFIGGLNTNKSLIDYDLSFVQDNTLCASSIMLIVAIILRWFNESRRRARGEEHQQLIETSCKCMCK